MISESQYYQKFYNLFIKKNHLLFDDSLAHDFYSGIPKPEGKEYQNLQSLLSIVEQKYGFNMCLNYKQLYLWQRTVMSELDTERMLAAGKLVLFCCLIDNLLDSPRFSAAEKDKICEKAGTLFFYSPTQEDRAYFTELDILAEDILQFYQDHPADPAYPEWKEDLYQAFQSESYMYRSALKKHEKLSDEHLSLLLDKSIKFEKAAFLTATYGYNTKQSVEAAELLGEVFWLVDDLCDFIEDVRAGRKNSLLFYCVQETGIFTLEKRIELVYANMDFAIDRLDRVLIRLKTLINRDMFSFIITQIWKWCHYVREVAK